MDNVLNNRDITLPTKVHIVKAMVLLVVMYGCDVRAGPQKRWTPENWCIWTVGLEKTIESPLYSKGITPVHPKGDQSWVFIGRTDAEAGAPILWPPYAKNWLIGKDPDAGKDWRREKWTTEDEMVGRHHWLDGYEFEQATGVGKQGTLACCSTWGCKESDPTEWLNWKSGIIDQEDKNDNQKAS